MIHFHFCCFKRVIHIFRYFLKAPREEEKEEGVLKMTDSDVWRLCNVKCQITLYSGHVQITVPTTEYISSTGLSWYLEKHVLIALLLMLIIYLYIGKYKGLCTLAYKKRNCQKYQQEVKLRLTNVVNNNNKKTFRRSCLGDNALALALDNSWSTPWLEGTPHPRWSIVV